MKIYPQILILLVVSLLGVCPIQGQSQELTSGCSSTFEQGRPIKLKQIRVNAENYKELIEQMELIETQMQASILGAIRTMKDLFRRRSGLLSETDQTLVKDWGMNVWPYYVFKELEDRLLNYSHL